jgi:dethiobiotin synthetase
VGTGLFIAGTQAQVGKTTVAAALAAALVRRGWRVAVMKPVQTGCPLVDGRAAPTDATSLRRAAGFDGQLEQICPYRFVPPFEPAVAARLEGVTVDLEHLVACYRRLAGEAGLVLVEGCGGLMAPLNEDLLMVDLVARLELSVLLVSPSMRNAINACLLNAELLRNRQLPLVGLVLNRLTPVAQPEEAANPFQIERFEGPIVRGVVPFLEPDVLGDPELLAHRLEVHVDLDAILAGLG